MLRLWTSECDWNVLIPKCQAGDQDAWNELVNCIQPIIRSAIRRVLRYAKPEEIDDITQEVLMLIYNRLINIKDINALVKWVQVIATRCAINARRTSVRRKKEINPLTFPDPEDPSTLPQPDLPDLGDCKEQVLAKLGQEYREVYDLLYEQGLTQKQAAEILNVVVKTIFNRKNLILTELALCLKLREP